MSKNLKDKNPITELLEKCHIEINTKDFDTKKIKAKKYKNKNAKYEVIINRTRKISNNIETQEFLVKYTKDDVKKMKKYCDMQKEAFSEKHLENNSFYQQFYIMNDELFLRKEHTTKEKTYSYKIDDFIIIDTKTKEILYNKKDILLLG